LIRSALVDITAKKRREMRLQLALRFVCVFITLQSLVLAERPSKFGAGVVLSITSVAVKVPAVTPSKTGVSMNISPTSASVQVGTRQQFTATLTGSTNTVVVWTVNNVVNGTTTLGTISNSGLYTAPAVVPHGSVAIKATSLADTQKYASALIAVIAQPAYDPSAFAEAELDTSGH
jgi:hypothetical protein